MTENHLYLYFFYWGEECSIFDVIGSLSVSSLTKTHMGPSGPEKEMPFG